MAITGSRQLRPIGAEEVLEAADAGSPAIDPLPRELDRVRNQVLDQLVDHPPDASRLAPQGRQVGRA